MKQVLPVRLAVLLMGLLYLAGCNPPRLGRDDSHNKTNGSKSGKKRIVVVPGGQKQAFWKSVRRGVEDAGREFGAEIVWSNTDDVPPLEQQVRLVREATAQKVDGIVLGPVERVGIVPPIDKAAKARIPIVILESGADTNNRLALIGSDSEQTGLLAARRLKKITGGNGKVGMVVNQSKSLSVSERELNFEKALSSESSGMQLVKSHDGLNIPASIVSDAENMLTANPDLKAIVALDEEATLAALKALRNRKLVGKVRVIGFDTTPPLLDALRRGEIDALLVQDPYKMGYLGVQSIANYRLGQRPLNRINTAIELATKENIDRVIASDEAPAVKAKSLKQ